MSSNHSAVSRAAELRRAFDRTFSEPLRRASDDCESLLLAKVGGAHYALKIRDLAGLVRCPAIVAIPSPTPALLGIAGLSGVPVAAFSLAALLGHADSDSKPRLLLLCGGEERVGFAFSQLEGCVQVSRSRLIAVAEHDAPSRHVRELADLAEVANVSTQTRPVIQIAGLLETINGRAREAARKG